MAYAPDPFCVPVMQYIRCCRVEGVACETIICLDVPKMNVVTERLLHEERKQPNEVTLGDGHPLKVAGQGVQDVVIRREYEEVDVLYVPALASSATRNWQV